MTTIMTESKIICSSIVFELMERTIIEVDERDFEKTLNWWETMLEEAFDDVDDTLRDFRGNLSQESDFCIESKEKCQVLYQCKSLVKSSDTSLESVVLLEPGRKGYGDEVFQKQNTVCYMSNLGLIRDEKIQCIYNIEEEGPPRPSDIAFTTEELNRNFSKGSNVSSKYLTRNMEEVWKLPKFQDRQNTKPVSTFYKYVSYVRNYLFGNK